MPEAPDAPYITLAPDWLCEVLSPSSSPSPPGRRSRTCGSSTYRIIKTFIADAKVRAEPFDAIELDLAILWRADQFPQLGNAHGGWSTSWLCHTPPTHLRSGRPRFTELQTEA